MGGLGENMEKELLEQYQLNTNFRFSELNAKLEEIFGTFSATNSEGFQLLANYFMLMNFELSVMQLAVRDIYCQNEKSSQNYKQYRKEVIEKIQRNLGDNSAVQTVVLTEQLNNCSFQLASIMQQSEKVQKQNEKLQKDTQAKKQNYNQIIKALKAYYDLAQWQEKCLTEVPEMQKRNSGLLKSKPGKRPWQSFKSIIPSPRYLI